MKVAYLLNRPYRERLQAIEEGRESDDHLYGMLRLRSLGVDTQCLELEDVLPPPIATFVREHVLNVYWAHAPLFFRLLRFDIVFASNAFGTQLLHALWPGRKPQWVMIDFNISGFVGQRRTLKQKLFGFLIDRCAGVVTIDAGEQQELQRLFRKPAGSIAFIRFGVDTDFFKPLPDAGEEDLIFSPGRDPGRDLATLYEATRELGQRVVTTMRPWTLKKYLPLPAHVSNEDLTIQALIERYANAKIVVIPLDYKAGTHNTMGCSTLLEAMSMGKAIVVTRTPMSESYATDGVNAVMVPPRDTRALRETIKKLLDDEGLRHILGVNAREFAVTHCSADVFARNLSNFFEQVLSRE